MRGYKRIGFLPEICPNNGKSYMMIDLGVPDSSTKNQMDRRKIGNTNFSTSCFTNVPGVITRQVSRGSENNIYLYLFGFLW